MRFASTMSVYEACKQVAEKINITGEDHGLFYPATHPKEKPYWLRMDRTLVCLHALSIYHTIIHQTLARPLAPIIILTYDYICRATMS
jgi:hypothetical protein